MQEKNVNAKCPHCGAELYLGLNKGTGFCTVCRKEFDSEKALKLFVTLYGEKEEPKEETKKANFGEDYLEVEKILTRAEYYFERKEFRKAREELEKALAITNSDYRVYFGIVRAETQNLTDYRNESHKEFLTKALECADPEEKKVITRLYKNFYQISTLSDEEILQYKKEENVAVKAKLEEKLKELIPTFIKKERGLKTSIVLSCVFALLTLGALIPFFIFQIPLLMLLCATFFALSYFTLRKYFTDKKLNALFNAMLDVYDALDSFELEVDEQKEVLDQMKNLRKVFSGKNNLSECEDGIFLLSAYLAHDATEKARNFITNHPLLCKYANAYVEE